MKYNIGDKVYMREDLEEWKLYDNMTYTSDMDKFKGKELTIKEIRIDELAYEFHNEINRYYVMEDDEDEWAFTDAMLKEDIKKGDGVMYDKNIKFEEKATKLVDENDKELKKVNELLELALNKLEMDRKELEYELLRNNKDKEIDGLVEEINTEYNNLECVGKNCLECEYGRSVDCETKFVIKTLIKKGMLKI